MSRLFRLLAACVAALVLTGCATSYLLDSRVVTYSDFTATPAPLTYRFERLPSQRAEPAEQALLEEMADAALYQAGFRRDDANPRYSVRVAAQIQPVLSPYADPWDYPFGWGWGWGWGFGYRGIGLGFGAPLFPRTDPAWHRREVSVIVRSLATNEVVYETRAISEGPWLAPRTVLPAMFQAALQGFPNPPPGPRRVDIRIGGDQPARAVRPQP